ncbi:MAG: hypothetical protein II584_03255 [Treponema sp.]|nr:hypothetical protein [Treponema sp.]
MKMHIDGKYMFKLISALSILISSTSCANYLNSLNPDECSALADAAGIIYTGNTTKMEIPVYGTMSLNPPESTRVDLKDGSVELTFTACGDTTYYIYFNDADSSGFTRYYSGENISFGDGKFSVLDRDSTLVYSNNESGVYTIPDFQPGESKIILTKDGSAGNVFIYVWSRSKYGSASSVSVQYGDSYSPSGFTQDWVCPGESHEYSFYARGGELYNIHWVDLDSSDRAGILGDDENLTYGCYQIYNSSGKCRLYGDISGTFTPDETDTYRMVVTTWGLRCSDGGPYWDGNTAFRIYQ